MDQPFSQELYNHLSTILERSVGMPLDMKQIDRLRFEADKLSAVITKHVEKVAQDKALQVCKLLNDATKAGFQTMAAELEQVKQLAAEAKSKADSVHVMTVQKF